MLRSKYLSGTVIEGVQVDYWYVPKVCAKRTCMTCCLFAVVGVSCRTVLRWPRVAPCNYSLDLLFFSRATSRPEWCSTSCRPPTKLKLNCFAYSSRCIDVRRLYDNFVGYAAYAILIACAVWHFDIFVKDSSMHRHREYHAVLAPDEIFSVRVPAIPAVEHFGRVKASFSPGTE